MRRHHGRLRGANPQRMSTSDRVRIHYQRLPDQEEIFNQRLILERDDVIVTVTDPLSLSEPIIVEGELILESGSQAVWFTFPGAWHDVGRFYRADHSFVGFYANVLTPPTINGRVWHTTDLFLDVWVQDDSPARILDEDELEEALEHGHIDLHTADRARKEATRLIELSKAGNWPPDIVREMTLARILSEEAYASASAR